MNKRVRVVGRVIAWIVVSLWLFWTALTLVYSNLQPQWVRIALASAYLLGLVVVSSRVAQSGFVRNGGLPETAALREFEALIPS